MSVTVPPPSDHVNPPPPARGLRGLVNAVWDRYGRFLHDTHRIPLQTLSLYRIVFALYLLVMNPIPDLRWIAAYPGEFHDPAPGLMTIWGGFPPSPVLIALEVGTVLAVCALAIGWRTAWTSIALTVIGLLANSVYMSFGKIDHTAVLWFAPALMAASGWGAFWSYDRWAASKGRIPAGSGLTAHHLDDDDVRSPGWPVASVAIMLGLAFLSAGLPKVVKGWLSFDSSGTLGYFRYLYFALGRDRMLADTFVNLDVAPFWELLDWSTVALELSLGLVLFWSLAHRWALFTAWMFHVCVMLVMNIPFFGPTPLYALFFLALVDRERSKRVGNWLMARSRVLMALLVPVAATALFGRGLYTTVMVDWIGLPVHWTDLSYFVLGLIVLVTVLVKSRGFTRTF